MSVKKNKTWYQGIKKKSSIINRRLDISMPASLLEIIETLSRHGFQSLIVGGSVRDSIIKETYEDFRNLTFKDLDVEVYGVPFQQMTEIINGVANKYEGWHASMEGDVFSVYKVNDGQGNDYDFSIPRRDSKRDTGHRGFDVVGDPNMSVEEAAARRDFTINSLAYDPVNGVLHDYFGGEQDIKDGVLRATSSAFEEDPLRVLRGMQFAARFGFEIEPETADRSSSLVDQISEEDPEKGRKWSWYEDAKSGKKKQILTNERIVEEWAKAFGKGKYPGKVIQYLIDTGWVDIFPEIKGIIDLEQEKDWHPEGTVDQHTAHVLDAAANIAERENLEGDERMVLLLSALGHDLGKSETTEIIEKKGVDRVTSHGHEEQSGPLIRSLLQRIGIGTSGGKRKDDDYWSFKKGIADKVVNLVENHMVHLSFDPKSKNANELHIAKRIHPASIKSLLYLIESDHSGRPPLPATIPPEALALRDAAMESGVYEEPEEPFLQGKDVMLYFNNIGGQHISQILQAVEDAQLKKQIRNREEALIFLDNMFKNNKMPLDINKDLQTMQPLLNGNEIMEILNIPGGPVLSQIKSEVWEMQKENKLNNKDEATQWLISNADRFVAPPEETEEDPLRFSDRNMKYFFIDKIAKREQEEMLRTEIRLLERKALMSTEYGKVDVSPRLDGETRTNYDELIPFWGNDVEIAMQLVPRELLKGVDFILTTDNSNVAGVFEPDLTDLLSGLAFRLSPEKINSEIEELIRGMTPYIDDLRQQMASTEFDSWMEDTERKITQLVIAEVIVHESTHAHGAEDEATPVSVERSFLNQEIEKINRERKISGIAEMPITLK